MKFQKDGAKHLWKYTFKTTHIISIAKWNIWIIRFVIVRKKYFKIMKFPGKLKILEKYCQVWRSSTLPLAQTVQLLFNSMVLWHIEWWWVPMAPWRHAHDLFWALMSAYCSMGPSSRMFMDPHECSLAFRNTHGCRVTRTDFGMGGDLSKP